MQITVIDMNRYPEECQICGETRWLDHCVAFYEEPVHDEIGTVLPNGDEVGGMTCCKPCHDRHYNVN